MKLSKRSWHLRYVRWALRTNGNAILIAVEGSPLSPDEGIYTPTNLCQYFWAFVMAGPSIVLSLGIIVPAIYVIKWLFVGLKWAIIGCAEGVSYIARHVSPTKGPGLGAAELSIEYLKAKKRRICPLIEVVP